MDGIIGEIKMFAGTFEPKGWTFCNGQSFLINEYEALHAIIGTIYGGDGKTYFKLPDLRGRGPVHQGQGFNLSQLNIGTKLGHETIKISNDHLPKHDHDVNNVSVKGKVTLNLGQAIGDERIGTNKFLAFHSGGDDTPYTDVSPSGFILNENSIDASGLIVSGKTSQQGRGEALNIRNPSLAISFIICYEGIFPPNS